MNNHILMSDLQAAIRRETESACRRLGLPSHPVSLRKIAPPRAWGYTTALPQELAGLLLAEEQARLESELGKKAAKKRLRARTGELSVQVAQNLADAVSLDALPGVAQAEAEGGYLNFYLDAAVASRDIISAVLERGRDFGRGEPQNERVMVEFSQPNTHKDFHVGHLRNVVLGNALANLFEFGGFEVLRANYYGDHGIHVAKALWGHLHPELLAEADTLLGGMASGSVYARVERLLTSESDNPRLVEIRAAAERETGQLLQQLNDSSSDAYALWRRTRQEDLDTFRGIYSELGVRFDLEFYESEVEKLTTAIVDELLEAGVAVVEAEGEYAGTVAVDFARHGAPELGIMVLRRSDGTTLYQTKELALAKVKFDEYKVDRSLYVVGSEQNLYFRQVFEILKLWGFAAAEKCQHVSYELVQLASGKMSSREGTVVAYRGFIEEAKERALSLARERGISSTPEKVASQVALGAVKYAFLRVDTNKTILFDWEQALSFDGNAGPYLQYAYARSNKLISGFKPDLPRLAQLSYTPQQAEVELCRTLADFTDCTSQALDMLAPNLIANYLYDLTRAFTDFYQSCPVLKAEDDVRFYRQSLVAGFNTALAIGAGLLGMELPEEM